MSGSLSRSLLPRRGAVMVEDWREDDNEHRPHSALGMQSPARFARAWRGRPDALAVSLRSPYGLTPRDGDTPNPQTHNSSTFTTGGPWTGPGQFRRPTGVSGRLCTHESKGGSCRYQRRSRSHRTRVPLVFRGASLEGERSGVLGMAFEIGGGSPVLGP
jgi:hypothetical protein